MCVCEGGGGLEGKSLPIPSPSLEEGGQNCSKTDLAFSAIGFQSGCPGFTPRKQVTVEANANVL